MWNDGILRLPSSLYAKSLQDHEKVRVFSQFGEDGVLLEIFRRIGTTNKYFVEVGVEDGEECNSRILREYFGWNGVLFDSGYSRPEINLYQEFITEQKINEVLERLNVPKEPDLASMDIDS